VFKKKQKNKQILEHAIEFCKNAEKDDEIIRMLQDSTKERWCAKNSSGLVEEIKKTMAWI
jgi:hypothetical protein